MHQNKCTVCTDNTAVYTFSEDSYSNLSLGICTPVGETIYLKLKMQVNLLIILLSHVILSFRHVKPYFGPLHR